MRRAALALAATGALVAATTAGATRASADNGHGGRIVRAAVPEGAIDHVLVIDLENENFAETFGATSPARYLNAVLLQQGQLVTNYFATSHVSQGNYISQVSGQATNKSFNDDCLDLTTLTRPPLLGRFNEVVPGTDAADGQVKGDGCVLPAPTATTHGARTIGNQLDQADDDHESADDDGLTWRAYMGDMGLDPVRDRGAPDPLGGTTCAHPPLGGSDFTNSAAANDQYATRHNPFVYFHAVIDDQAYCDRHVVPLGSVTADAANPANDTFRGHLAQDLADEDTTPAFLFVSPNLCDDGHDATCVGKNVEGDRRGGLVALDLWLKHWMPMILGSEAYRDGKMLVVVTFDEANPVPLGGRAADSRSCCNQPSGPNVTDPGFSNILGLLRIQAPPSLTNRYPGGGQVGAVLLNSRWIEPGTVNTTGQYNHFSALRSYEDILGLTEGGDDGYGHLGYAGQAGLVPFGADVFNARHR